MKYSKKEDACAWFSRKLDPYSAYMKTWMIVWGVRKAVPMVCGDRKRQNYRRLGCDRKWLSHASRSDAECLCRLCGGRRRCREIARENAAICLWDLEDAASKRCTWLRPQSFMNAAGGSFFAWSRKKAWAWNANCTWHTQEENDVRTHNQVDALNKSFGDSCGKGHDIRRKRRAMSLLWSMVQEGHYNQLCGTTIESGSVGICGHSFDNPMNARMGATCNKYYLSEYFRECFFSASRSHRWCRVRFCRHLQRQFLCWRRGVRENLQVRYAFRRFSRQSLNLSR